MLMLLNLDSSGQNPQIMAKNFGKSLLVNTSVRKSNINFKKAIKFFKSLNFGRGFKWKHTRI